MSPAMKRIFTISAGDRSVFSARIWGVEPRTTWSSGPDGAGGGVGAGAAAGLGAGAGAAAAAGATSASGAVAGAAGSGAAAFGFGLGVARGFGGGSITWRGLAAFVALPPEARRRGTRSSGTLDEADFPVTPI